MACFVVPAAEAVITTVASKIIKSKESSEKTEVMNEKVHLDGKKTIPFSKKMVGSIICYGAVQHF